MDATTLDQLSSQSSILSTASPLKLSSNVAPKSETKKVTVSMDDVKTIIKSEEFKSSKASQEIIDLSLDD